MSHKPKRHARPSRFPETDRKLARIFGPIVKWRDRLIIFLLLLLLVKFLWMLDPITRIVLAIIAAFIAAFILVLAYYWIRFLAVRPYIRLMKRIEAGEAEQVLYEVTVRRQQKPASAALPLIQAIAATKLQRFDDSMRFAQEAERLRHAQGLHHQQSNYAKWVTDAIESVIANQMMIAGDYFAVAERTVAIKHRWTNPNQQRAFCAFAYFLAGKDDLARDMLAGIVPEAEAVPTRMGPMKIYPANVQGTSAATYLEPKFAYMVAYLRHKLLDDDQRAALSLGASTMLQEWETSADHTAGTPYGQRLKEIIDDIREIIA